MATAWLCQIDAFARVGSAATTIRLASHDDDRLCHLDGQVWWPAIARLPRLAYDFFDGAFGGEIVTPSGQADVSIDAVPGFAGLMLHGARIRWWTGELGAAWGDFTLRFDGLIDNHPTVRDGMAALDFRVDDAWLDDPILATYAGTTGAEGEAALKGQVKPLLLGVPTMVEGVLVNSVDTIVQLNDGPIAAVDVAMEDAARFPASAGDYASYAALRAATIAPGYYATALAVGMVRHGAPPAGVLTYNVQGSNSGADGGGHVRRAGAIIKRLAARMGKAAKVDAGGLTALDSARPWNISVALQQQVTMRELVQSIAQSLNAVAVVTWTGLLTVLPIPRPEDATAVGTLAADGSSLPPVARVDQLGIAAPWWRVAIEAEITNRVHGNDEIRFTAQLIERGIYDHAETYFEGHIVSGPDGSRWLYIGITPTAGNDPFDGSAYWDRMSPPASGFTWYAYADAPDGSFNFTTGAPGSRTYQGIATGKTTATESTNYLDYAWSPYVGPPNFGLANFNSNTVLAGNKLIKVAGGSAWNASVHSTESFKGGASVSFVVDDKNKSFAVGLNTDPTTDAGRDSIDFAIFCDAGGMRVYEGGVHIGGFGSFANDDVGTVTYNDKTVVYSRNGVPFYTNASPPSGLTLFLDTSINSPGAQVGRILSFTAAGTAGADGSDGIDGIDGNDGVSPVSAVAIPLNKQFTADSDGTVKAGQLPFNVAISATKAGASIGGTVSIGTPSGCTATAISGGFTIDTVSADSGFVPWTFTATDGQVVEGKVSFSRQRDPASGGQVSVNFSSTSWWGSGSYGSSGPSTVLPASSTGKLAISGFASFYCSGNGEARLTAKLQYRAVGSGTWIDAGFSSGPGIAIKTADMPGEPGENTPGEVNPTGTLTGLTANGSYEVQMVGSRNASYNAIAAATGFITLRQVL